MPTGAGARRKKHERAPAFSPKRSRRHRDVPNAPRLVIVPASASSPFSTPAPVKPPPARTRRRRARDAAPAFVELECDPISNARFSTPRPDTNKRKVNSAFHVSSAKKRKVVHVKPRAPPPHFSIAESHFKDVAKMQPGLLAAHPTISAPTCELTESMQIEEPGNANGNESTAPTRTAKIDSTTQPENKMQAPSVCVGKEGTQNAPNGECVESEPPETLMEPVECISSVERTMSLSPNIPLGGSPVADSIHCSSSDEGAAISSPNHSERKHFSTERSGVSSEMAERNQAPTSAGPDTLMKKPPAFSISLSPSQSSPREAGLLAAHPTLEVQTCGSEDFVSPPQREQETHSVSRLSVQPVQESEVIAQVAVTPPTGAKQGKGNLNSCNGAANMDECISPAFEDLKDANTDEKLPPSTERNRIRFLSSTKRALILCSDSQPLDKDEEFDDEPSRIPPTPLPVPAELHPSMTPLTSRPVYPQHRDCCVLVPETPSSDGASPVLVNETPASASPPENLRASSSHPRASTTTPATGQQRRAPLSRVGKTPPVFVGFTPKTASAHRNSVSARSRRVSWSDGYDSHPLCGQASTPFAAPTAVTPAAVRRSPPVVLGTKLRRAWTPRAVTPTWSRGLFSTAGSVGSGSPSPPAQLASVPSAGSPAEDAVNDGGSAGGSPGESEGEDRIFVPETCVPETPTPDSVCLKALAFVKARAQRFLREASGEESDASTEPPPKEEGRMRRIFRTFDAQNDILFANGPRPMGMREGVPSGALAIVSDSDGDDEE